MIGAARLVPTLPDSAKALAIGLQRAGWEVRDVDVDLIAGRAKIELHRFDGRWLYLVADSEGRASIERWHRTRIVTRYRGGPECDGSRDDFLGRERFEGARSALRSLCTYVAENPAPGFASLPAPDVRNLLRPVLQ